MQIVKRSAAIFSIAAFVPLVVLGSFYVATLLEQKYQTIEEKTMARAYGLMSQIDEKLSNDLDGLAILSSSKPFVEGNWEQARAYTSTFAGAFSAWRTIVLLKAVNNQLVWETSSRLDEPAVNAPKTVSTTVPPINPDIFEMLRVNRECECVMLQKSFVVNNIGYLLSVKRSLTDIQDSLMAAVHPGEVAALVDRDGNFIARTVDYKARLGTPATRYVRDAVERGGSGVYSGTTYEGLQNRTAYVSSKLSGWSTHIAVPSSNYIALWAGSITFAAIGIFSALLFAAFAIWYAINDLAVWRHNEKVRVRSQKLEAIGHLSGAVVHDFNNLLVVMTTCLRFLDGPIEKIKKDKIIQEGLAAAVRGEKLVKQLLTFARDKPMELECVNIENTVEAIQSLLVRCLGPGVNFDTNILKRANYVHTNATQLEIALLNLAVNARDAMPNGGTFSISTRLSAEAGFVDFIVKDTGVGMTKDIAAQAMEPFFTTKEAGEGTGLGLAQVQLLAQESLGLLHLETEPGKGTTFILQLPSCKPN